VGFDYFILLEETVKKISKTSRDLNLGVKNIEVVYKKLNFLSMLPENNCLVVICN
jgi:hypothetical protein